MYDVRYTMYSVLFSRSVVQPFSSSAVQLFSCSAIQHFRRSAAQPFSISGVLQFSRSAVHIVRLGFLFTSSANQVYATQPNQVLSVVCKSARLNGVFNVLIFFPLEPIYFMLNESCFVPLCFSPTFFFKRNPKLNSTLLAFFILLCVHFLILFLR